MKNILKSKWIDILIVIILIGLAIGSRFFSYLMVENQENKDLYKDSENIPYFHDMDSYYYSSLMELAIENDNPFKIFNEENPYRFLYEKNNHSSSSDKYVLLPFIGSILYKIVDIFSNISVNKFISFLAPILYSLTVIPAYIYVKKKTNRLGAVSAGIITGLNPAFMYYTGASSFDTDILLFILPLVFVITFIEAITSDKKILYSILSFISLILLLFAWNSSVVYILLIFVISFVILFIDLIKNKFKIVKVIKKRKILLINILGYILIYLLIYNVHCLDFFVSYFGESSLYPDPGRFISELSDVSILVGGIWGLVEITSDGIINRCGGIFGCIFLVICIVMMIYELIRTKSNNKILIISLLIWFIGAFISVFNGVRFFKILIIPLMLIVSLGIGNISKTKKIKKYKEYIMLLIIMLVLVPYIQGFIVAMKQQPSGNDLLSDTSEWIKNNTADDAIIASWWDNGYYYEYKANRATLSDGGTYNGRYYLFMSKAFITTDITLTKNIFNMLATNGLEASYQLDKYFNSEKKSTEVLIELLYMTKAEAINNLIENYNMNEEEAKEIVRLTHTKSDRDILLVVSSDMLQIMQAINYYGNYDFDNPDNDNNIINSNSVIYALSDACEYEGLERLQYIKSEQLDESINIWKIN